MPSTMQIESIAIKNYRCFRDIVLNDLSRMTVVVGANGSGKSSLFDVFSFLEGCLDPECCLRGGQARRV